MISFRWCKNRGTARVNQLSPSNCQTINNTTDGSSGVVISNTETTITATLAGGTDDDSLISRSGMQKYLRDSFARNKPYDKMVYELITATGTTSRR